MEGKIRTIGEVCFWIAIVIELLAVIIDKSAYTNPYESLIFRTAFLLCCIKIVTTRYSRGECLLILAVGVIVVLSYLINTRDEAVRALALVVACKDIDLRKALKIILAITLAGSITLAILSLLGIYGAVSVTADFGRDGIETRYCFGMGHPNAFHCMLLMIISLVIYLYGPKMRPVHYALIFIVNMAAYYFTDSNTAFIVLNLILTGIILLRYCPKLYEKRIVYICGAVVFVITVLFSVYGAAVGTGTDFMYRLDKLLNGRFQYSYIYENARLINWRLFALPENVEFFDQGFIRLFYWYGIIPGVLYVAGNLYLIYQSWLKKDYCLLVIVVGYAVFSVMEAHLISVYLLRNYLLIWIGYYWYQPFISKSDDARYLWQMLQKPIKGDVK